MHKEITFHNDIFEFSRSYLDVKWSDLKIEAYAVNNGNRTDYYVDGYLTKAIIGLYAGKFLPNGNIEINPAKVDSAQAEFDKYLEQIRQM